MLDPEDTHGLEQPVVRLYEEAELYLIALIAEAIVRTGGAPNLAEAQLLEIRRLRRAAESVSARVWVDAPKTLVQVVEQAYVRGQTAAAAELLDAYEKGHAIPGVVEPRLEPYPKKSSPPVVVPSPGAEPPVPMPPHTADPAPEGKQQPRLAPKAKAPKPVPSTHQARSIVNISRKGAEALHPVHKNICRRVDDIWRAIINEASGLVINGDMTPQQAMQHALDKMAKKGLGFFEDKAGRKWGLDTYAEMATRTATNQALRAGHTDQMIAEGVDLVVISSHKNPAPQCAPFERKVLSLTGKYTAGSHTVDGEQVTVTATMQDAEARGLHHPHCRHTHSMYLPGVTPTDAPPVDPNHEGYKATQKQRYLERQVRASRRMEVAAITDEAKRKAVQRRKLYEGKLQEHTKTHGLRRKPEREQLRGPTNTKAPE